MINACFPWSDIFPSLSERPLHTTHATLGLTIDKMDKVPLHDGSRRMVQHHVTPAFTCLADVSANLLHGFERFKALGQFGEVESTGTSTRGMEGLSLSNGAVFPVFLWTGKHCETSKLPRFTKTGEEPK